MTLIERIVEQQNLTYAWQKVQNNILEMSGWVDREELWKFEALIERELKYIHDRLLDGEWSPDKMMPLPWPKISKSKDSKNDKMDIRQMFWVSIRDQVAWVAVVNIIGEIIDPLMPEWSIANRLYRPCWYDDPTDYNSDKRGKFRIGPYRHYSGKIYIHWAKSWIRYRRLSYLTWLAMKEGKNFDISTNNCSERLQQEYQDNKNRLKYLDPNYWNKPNDEIFWAKIDFKKFYPELNRNSVIKGIKFGLEESNRINKIEVESFVKLLKKMMKFHWKIPGEWSKEELKSAYFLNKESQNKGIPTGLLVSHFLANVAMLPIDINLQRELDNQSTKTIAHFRYVDDHLILSTDFGELKKWIDNYKKEIKKIGIRINAKKTEPEPLRKRKKYKLKADNDISEECKINPNNPYQLKTQTLDLISAFAQQDFGLLHLDEQEILLRELEHLLKANLDNDEIREDTKQTFAIYRIIKLIIDWQRDWSKIVEDQRNKAKRLHEIQGSYEKNNLEGEKESIIKGLKHDEETLKFPDKKEFCKKVKKIFKDLMDIIRDHPDKKGLWGAAIDFCRSTGHFGCDEICDILKRKERPYKFLRAFIWQKLGDAVIETARADNIYSWEKMFYNEFYKNINQWQEKLSPEKNEDREYFELKAWEYLQNCIKLSKIIKDDSIIQIPFSFNNPILYYWAEQNLVARDSHEPSELLKTNLSKLDKNNEITKILKLRYSELVNDEKELKVIGKEFGLQDISWMFEHPKSSNDTMTLFEWCNWLSKSEERWNENGIYYPHMSEWTALEIVKQVCNKYIKNNNKIAIEAFLKKQVSNKQVSEILPHPANIILPNVWQNTEQDTVIWKTWERLIRDNTIYLEDNITMDIRLNPYWLNKGKTYFNDILLYGCGLLLLGILRRSFNWPSIWNIPGHSCDWRGITKSLFDESPCSTTTMSILVSLLSAKSIESKRIKIGQQLGFDDDTQFDPELIKNMNNLIDRIEKAQKIISDHQIMSFNSSPRQLIPIQLPDIIKRKWFNE